MQLVRAAGWSALGVIMIASGAAAQSVDLAAFRMKADSVTLVLGTVEMERPVGGARPCPYKVELKVTDTRGASLMNEQWREDRGCVGGVPRSVKTYEALRFATRPGRYDIAISMNPEGNAQEARRTALTIETLPSTARASDLVLAREIGVVDSTNTTRWTVRHDGIGIAAEPGSSIAAESPRLFFYLEVYGKPSENLTGKLSGSVIDATGNSLAEVDLANINGKNGKTRLAGSMVVAGLAPGQYTLNTTVRLGDTSFVRSANFVMAPPVVVAQASGSGYFENLSSQELALTFDPLVVWMESKAERDLYSGLNEAGKKQFLIRYFGTGPTGNADSRIDTYLARVRQVNEQYTERTGNKTLGWQTDRGRIYLLRGEPANQVKRPFAPNDVKPYEIWAYNLGSQYVYVFVDETRFGSYRLVFTTDPREISLPDWQNRVGPAVMEELRTTFGVRVQ